MRFGITLGATGTGRDPSGLAQFAVLAEESGWDALFLDYLVYHGRPELRTYDRGCRWPLSRPPPGGSGSVPR